MIAVITILVTYLTGPLSRWVIIGGFFEMVGTPLLVVMHGIWLVPLFAATLLVAEFTTLPRFFVNDRFVFGHPQPCWHRLWQYHVACAGGFAVWFAVANVLPLLGVHYVLAALCASACSVGLAIASNFGWVWRRSDHSPSPAPLNTSLELR